MTPPHGGYPTPRRKKPMTVEDHKAQIDANKDNYPEGGDDVLHELLCAVYATPDAQNC
jgi:hypothetical protein